MGWEQDLCLLSEAENQMFTPALDTSADLAITLLIHYSFDLSGYSAIELINVWQKQYPGNWLHLAVIEALYQGRYKAISVQQILICWQRRGQAIFHFNMEFERLICSKFPQSLASLSPTSTGQGKGEDTFVQESSPLLAQLPDQDEKVPVAQRQWRKIGGDGNVGSSQETALIPVPTNNPPIEQFSPATTQHSESFTSKLKAISNEKLLPLSKPLFESLNLEKKTEGRRQNS